MILASFQTWGIHGNIGATFHWHFDADVSRDGEFNSLPALINSGNWYRMFVFSDAVFSEQVVGFPNDSLPVHQSARATHPPYQDSHWKELTCARSFSTMSGFMYLSLDAADTGSSILHNTLCRYLDRFMPDFQFGQAKIPESKPCFVPLHHH